MSKRLKEITPAFLLLLKHGLMPLHLVHAHTNPNILKTAEFLSGLRVDGTLNFSENLFQNNAVTVTTFTGFVWTEVCGFKNFRIRVDLLTLAY